MADEPCFPADHGCAQGPKSGLRVIGGDVGDDALDMGAHGVPVYDRCGQTDTETAGLARGFCRVARREQRFAGHATEIQAVAAHAVPLDQCHANAELRGAGGDGQAGGTGADH